LKEAIINSDGADSNDEIISFLFASGMLVRAALNYRSIINGELVREITLMQCEEEGYLMITNGLVTMDEKLLSKRNH